MCLRHHHSRPDFALTLCDNQATVETYEVNEEDILPTSHLERDGADLKKDTDASFRKKNMKDASKKGLKSEALSGKKRLEYHLVIQTVEDGFNSGRRYVHRVAGEVADEWPRKMNPEP